MPFERRVGVLGELVAREERERHRSRLIEGNAFGWRRRRGASQPFLEEAAGLCKIFDAERDEADALVHVSRWPRIRGNESPPCNLSRSADLRGVASALRVRPPRFRRSSRCQRGGLPRRGGRQKPCGPSCNRLLLLALCG